MGPMPAKEILKLFLASPGDVSQERDRVEEVVKDVNLTYGEEHNLRIEVTRWETHVFPGYGSDPQDVVNRQIADMTQFDLFVGIMWNRFGTPTPRAGSGTGEEFERAAQAFEQHGRPHIMFYFREAKANLKTREQLEQRGKVLEFRTALDKKGLSKTYTSVTDFEKKFRNDLLLWLRSRERPRPEPAQEAAEEAKEAAQTAIPVITPNFVGRETDVERILERLRSHRIVTIWGLGGMGKSEMAKAVARRAQEQRWPEEGVRYIDLQSATDAAGILSTLTFRLGLQPTSDLTVFARELSGNFLYVLDDVYQAMQEDHAGVLGLVRALHDYAGPATFLLTSRELVGLPNVENAFPLDTLQPPYDEQLFRELAEDASYRWQQGDDERLQTLLHALEGYPLAITLAAYLLNEMTLEMVLGRWQAQRTAMLQIGNQGDKLTSVDVSLGLTYNNLPAFSAPSTDESQPVAGPRTLFALFGDLPGGATEEMLKAVIGEKWYQAASALVRHSLVQIRYERYTMLVPVREFAMSIKNASCEPVRQRLDAYLLKLAQKWGGDDNFWIRDPEHAVRVLTSELPNLHAAMDRAHLRQDDLLIASMIDSLGRYYSFAMPGAEATKRLQSGNLANEAIGDKQGQANCIKCLGDVHYGLGEYPQARNQYETAQKLYEAIGDKLGQANCIRRLGDVHRMLGEYPQAREQLEAAQKLYEAIGDKQGQANCIICLGDVHRMLGEYPQARQQFEAAMQIYQHIGDRYGLAVSYWRLGDLCANEEKWQEAVRWGEQSAQLFEEIGVSYWAERARQQAEEWRKKIKKR